MEEQGEILKEFFLSSLKLYLFTINAQIMAFSKILFYWGRINFFCMIFSFIISDVMYLSTAEQLTDHIDLKLQLKSKQKCWSQFFIFGLMFPRRKCFQDFICFFLLKILNGLGFKIYCISFSSPFPLTLPHYLHFVSANLQASDEPGLAIPNLVESSKG